jgi:hypothetical protein
MSEPMAVVMTTVRVGNRPVDSERRVTTLRELYEACRDAPPSALVRVALRGDDGEVVLNFGSLIRP